MNLEEVRKHMSARDHLSVMISADSRFQVYMALADDVPDLVAEIERLNDDKALLTGQLQQARKHVADADLQIERLKAALTEHHWWSNCICELHQCTPPEPVKCSCLEGEVVLNCRVHSANGKCTCQGFLKDRRCQIHGSDETFTDGVGICDKPIPRIGGDIAHCSKSTGHDGPCS